MCGTWPLTIMEGQRMSENLVDIRGKMLKDGGEYFTLKCFANFYRPCGLVVRVLGYRSGGPGSIPGTTKKSSGSGTGSTRPREYN
jgi:hypothetical protein